MDITKFFKRKAEPPVRQQEPQPAPVAVQRPSDRKSQPTISFTTNAPARPAIVYDDKGKIDLNASMAYKLAASNKKRYSETELLSRVKKPKRCSVFDRPADKKEDKRSAADIIAAYESKNRERTLHRFSQTLSPEEADRRRNQLRILNDKLRAGESLLRRSEILGEDNDLSEGITNTDLELHGYMSEDYHMALGQGPVNAELLIIGDYPTKEECHNGRAFSGIRGGKFKEFLLKAGIDADTFCYVTNVVKINIPRQKYTFDEIQDHLEYLREEINIIRPKQILCVGRLSATIAQNGFKLLERVRHKYAIRRGDGEREDGVVLESFYKLQKHGTDQIAATFREFRHVSRVYMFEEIGTFFASQGKEAFRKKWISKLGYLKDMMSLDRPPYIDLEEELENYYKEHGKGTLDETAQELGIHYSKPTDVLFEPSKNSAPVPEDYHLGLIQKNQKLRFYLIERTFSEEDNCFVLFGRLKEGNSVSIIAKNPKFFFYVDHPSFEQQYPKEGQSKNDKPKLSDIELSLRRLLIPYFKSLGFKYADMTEKELWDFIGIKLEYTLNRSAIGFQKYRSTHLKISYNVHSHKHKLREYIKQILGQCAIEQSDISPVKFLNLVTDVTSYSWVEVDPTKLRVPRTYSTSGELEYEVDVVELKGKRAVKNGDYQPTPENESHARLRTAQLDGEMIKLYSNNGALPIPEIHPIGRLCVLIADKNDHDRPTLLDTVRSLKRGCEREVTTTGRANYVDCASFIVGPHAEIEPKKFDPKRLPWVPAIPNSFLKKEFSSTSVGCLTAVYKWSIFIDQFVSWYGYVGSFRARKLLHPQVYELLDSYITDKQSVLLEITDAGKKDPKVYTEWRNNLRIIRKRWHLGKLDESIELPENQPPSALVGERLIGSIQYNWTACQPKTKHFFFKDERSMLASFVEYCRQADVDGFSGHNVCNFDMRYIIKRLQVLDIRWSEFWRGRGSELISLGRGNYQSRGFLSELSHDTLSRKVMDTSANGKREFTIVNIPGRFTFDTLNWAQKDGPAGLPGFSLNRLAEKILDDRKGDLPWTSIPVQFFTRPENLTKYCWQDTELCERICNVCDVQSFVVVSSRIIDDITLGEFYNTGVQRKNVSIFLTTLRDGGASKLLPDENPFSKNERGESVFGNDYIGKENNPVGDDEDDEELEEEEEELLETQKLPERERETVKRARDNAKAAKFDPWSLFADEPPAKRLKRKIALYEGARVIQVVKGLYHKPIPTLDFAQLYPSIIISENLGLNTIGRLEHFLALGYTKEDLWTSGEQYPDPWNPGTRCEWYFLKRRRLSKEVAEQLPAFDDQPAGLAQCVKNADGTYTPRLEISDFATQLEFLSVLRGYYKKLRDTVGRKHPLYKAYEAAQNAVKILMNSLYGATGVRTGKLACLPIGASVTWEGRRTLTEVESWMKDYFGATIIGGDTDSVFVMFPNVNTLDDIYAPVTMLTDPDKPPSEVNVPIELPFIDHVVRFINRRQKPAKSIIFEKALWPLNMFACKKSDYGNNLPERDPVTGKPMFALRRKIKITSKGTENKRRSTAPYAKRIFDKFDGKLLGKVYLPLEQRVQQAVSYVRRELKKILDGEFDYSQMVLTSYYGKSDDQYANQNHPTLVINRKRVKRGEDPYQLGERVPRVVVVNSNPKAKFFEKVEDPMYAMKNNIPLDLDYYIEKQLRAPLRRKIENIDPKLEDEMFADVDAARKKLRPGQGLYSYLTRKCEFCDEQSVELICEKCLVNLSKEDCDALFECRKIPLRNTIAKQNKVCYACLGVDDEQGEIECTNIYCAELPKRVIPTTRLRELEERQVKIGQMLSY